MRFHYSDSDSDSEDSGTLAVNDDCCMVIENCATQQQQQNIFLCKLLEEIIVSEIHGTEEGGGSIKNDYDSMGDLSLLYEHDMSSSKKKCRFTSTACEIAAACGNVEVLDYLYEINAPLSTAMGVHECCEWFFAVFRSDWEKKQTAQQINF